MDKEDAEGRIALLSEEAKSRDEQIAVFRAEAEFERGLIEQFLAGSTDATLPEADRELAAEQLEFARAAARHADEQAAAL